LNEELKGSAHADFFNSSFGHLEKLKGDQYDQTPFSNQQRFDQRFSNFSRPNKPNLNVRKSFLSSH